LLHAQRAGAVDFGMFNVGRAELHIPQLRLEPMLKKTKELGLKNPSFTQAHPS